MPGHPIPIPNQVLSPTVPNFESRPAPVSSSVPSHVPSPISSVPSHVPNPVPSVPSPMPSSAPVSVQEKPKKILVYSRRQKAQKEVENRILSQQCQEVDMSSLPPGNHTSNDSHNSICPEVSNDLDQPIALTKEKRSCTLRPISKFVSFKGLSSRYKAFSTALPDTHIPKSIREAPSQPEWKKAVMEEMGALETLSYQKGRSWSGVSGFFNADGSFNRFKSQTCRQRIYTVLWY